MLLSTGRSILARLCVFLALLFAFAGTLTPAHAQTFVQQNISADNAPAATTVTVTISAGGTGDLMCGTVFWTAPQTLSSVKDNNGVSYNVVDTLTDSGQSAADFYLPNISGAPTSIIATFSASTSFPRIEVQEWSGIATTTPLDGHTATVSTTNPSSSGSITTTVNGDLIYGGTAVTNSSAVTLTAGVGYTIRNNGGGPGSTVPMADESQIQSTAGSISAGFGMGAAFNAATFIMAFKAAAASTCPVTRTLMGVGC